MENENQIITNASSEAVLKEINERLIRMEKRQLNGQRTRIVIFAIIMLALIILAAVMIPKIITISATVNELVNELSEIDPEALEQTVETVNNLDVDGLNSVISSLETIDFTGISNAIAKLESALAGITSFLQ